MTMKFYKVLYNACYGGFDLDHEAIRKLFRAFHPHSTFGDTLWRRCLVTLDSEDAVKRESILIPGYTELFFVKPWCGRRRRGDLYAKHSSSGSIYNLSMVREALPALRENQALIDHLERVGDIGRPMGIGCLGVANIPLYCSYTLLEYDGLESVEVQIPIRQAFVDLLTLISTGGKEPLTPLHPWTSALMRGDVDLAVLDSMVLRSL